MLRISGFYDNNCTNGDGWRSVIFFSGCPHCCADCQNPATWDYDLGHDVSVDELNTKIEDNLPLIDGITLSGGEPFQERHVEDIIELITETKSKGLNVWCYTGYTYEEIQSHPEFSSMLNQIDILVDGQFDQKLLDPELKFRGSSNQRIIDVQKSLQKQSIVLNSK